jgi:hypothetical protein
VGIWAWVLIAAAVVALIVIVMVMATNRRTTRLRQQFGPEYERTRQEREGRRAAESDLRNRQKQRAQLDIHPLPEPARARYADQWRELQQRFIDEPSSAVLAADTLVRQVMNDEGYPIDDFNQQAELVSVDHPRIVENYRAAHSVCERTQTQQASTEDMRTALLSYRSLFDELLHTDGDGSAERAATGNTDGRARPSANDTATETADGDLR